MQGAKGGTATITIDVVRVLGLYIGQITVRDPSEHLDTTALIATTTLTRGADSFVAGTATGVHDIRLYTLDFNI